MQTQTKNPAASRTSTTTHEEGHVAKAIESQTAKLPSDIFLWSALGILAASTTLFFVNQRHTSLLVGQLVAPMLLFGIYNKMVKQSGHDRTDSGRTQRKSSV
jgi:hypothetical protein